MAGCLFQHVGAGLALANHHYALGAGLKARVKSGGKRVHECKATIVRSPCDHGLDQRVRRPSRCAKGRARCSH